MLRSCSIILCPHACHSSFFSALATLGIPPGFLVGFKYSHPLLLQDAVRTSSRALVESTSHHMNELDVARLFIRLTARAGSDAPIVGKIACGDVFVGVDGRVTVEITIILMHKSQLIHT